MVAPGPCEVDPSQATSSQPASSKCDTKPTNEDPDDTYIVNPEPENEHLGLDEDEIFVEVGPKAAKKDADLDDDYFPGTDSESDTDHDEDGYNEDEESEEDEMVEDKVAPKFEDVIYDKDDPPMAVGTLYPNMHDFRVALSSHAIKHEFEYLIEKSGPGRCRAFCGARFEAANEGYMHLRWVTINPHLHTCKSSRRHGKVKGATKHWVVEKVKDWLVENNKLGPKELQRRIKEKYKVEVHYKRVYHGKEVALNQLYGNWQESFDNLYRFKAQIEQSSLGSLVVMDHHTINKKIRPYLSVDSTFLTGRFRGQLYIACAVNGHNWMYHVAIRVIDFETNENWIWFMKRLKEAIGTPPGLTFSIDCGIAVMEGVSKVFSDAEHRECMFHLVQNFKKRFRGKVFDDHLWASAYRWNSYMFEKHYKAMAQERPETAKWLQENHTKLWTRSQFSTLSKVDYVTNNLVESCNH
ncbi:hypothetical protein U9M48_014311 [Paspalum notatum var. saurae]|uniref:MULE transposase domain-containing protein n=1 Tax=Paspalum notatum var. saurae TaxID=547442 RepID=A0AAQ3T1C1_PASNO